MYWVLRCCLASAASPASWSVVPRQINLAVVTAFAPVVLAGSTSHFRLVGGRYDILP